MSYWLKHEIGQSPGDGEYVVGCKCGWKGTPLEQNDGSWGWQANQNQQIEYLFHVQDALQHEIERIRPIGPIR